MIQLAFIIQMFCQIVAVIAGILIVYYRRHDSHWYVWLTGPLAFFLMFLRRLTAFVIEFRVETDYLGRVDRLWLPATISILLLVFILQIYRFVEDHDN